MANALAARLLRAKDPAGLVMQTIDIGDPNTNSVRLRVEAAGMNPLDWKIRDDWFPAELPITLGQDVAGVVEQAGPGSRYEVGARLFGMLPMTGGAYAERVLARGEWLARMPDDLGFDAAATVPMPAMTAWHAVVRLAAVHAGERVLVHGAGGAVGGFAAQMCVAAGAYVIANATAADADRLRAWGVEQVIDHTNTRFENVLRSEPVDIVVDVLAGPTRDRSWSVLRDGGRMVSTLGQAKPPPEAARRGVRGLPGFGTEPDGDLMSSISSMLSDGSLRPLEPTRKPLHDAPEVLDQFSRGELRGKVVLVPG